MHLIELSKLKIENVKTFLLEQDPERTTKQKRTRNSSLIGFENIIVNDFYFGRTNSKRNRTLFANVSEVSQAQTKSPKRQHLIEVKFFNENDNVQAVVCTKCNKTKDNCSAISNFINWIQGSPRQNDQENVAPIENLLKKTTKECYVLIKNENILPAPIPLVSEAPILTKLKKAAVVITPLQLNTAQKLSMISLIREFKGSSPGDFMKFCTNRMQENNCNSVELLTIEQADTDLWHELRKGRITASRMHEASRCTMRNGSLTNKIMGISSGFSFAMKRGTDLEGHVFAVLQKEYPGLRNTGLVLDPHFPWMGASPDGICEDFVLEIKCPYTQKTHECYVDVKKLSKTYFAQIQMQMHMTHKTKALLGVAALDFETSRKVTKVWIDYDKTYVDQIMAESYEFWCKAVFPALLKKRSSKK